MQTRSERVVISRLLFMLAFTFLSSGCLPVTTAGTNPGGAGNDGGAPGGVPAVGHVAFHDTDLTLMATVDLGGQLFTTEDGRFALTLRRGTHHYKLFTLLGTYSGDVAFGGDASLRLEVPAFAGWSSLLFDGMAFTEGRDFTTRWERDRDVKVWIQPYTYASEEAAITAFRDWRDILEETITFTRVRTADEADMTMRFVHSSELPGHRTIGTCTRWYRTTTGFMMRGEIKIDRSWADHLGLHRHEVGHCIGLGHSHDRGHLMYPVLYNYSLTPAEKNIARLLYSVPPKTVRLTDTSAAQTLDAHLIMQYVEPGSDLVVETIR